MGKTDTTNEKNAIDCPREYKVVIQNPRFVCLRKIPRLFLLDRDLENTALENEHLK